MNELPEGWAPTQLGVLTKSIVGGGTPSKANPAYFQGEIPFMTVKDLHVRFVADTQDHISAKALEDSASTLVPADTLVVATRMSLGKITRPLVPVAINQDLKAIFLHDGIDKTYVEYLWRANESRIQEMGTGTTVKGIRLEDIRGLDVPLAPSAEQSRIANQLDTLLTRIQNCSDRFDAIPALLKRFRQTTLDSATLGSLTKSWREDNGGEYEWKDVRLSDIAEVQGGVTKDAKKQSALDEEVPYLRVANVQRGYIDLTEVKTIRVPNVKLESLLLQNGDVLFNEGGDLDKLGRGWVWESQIPRCTFQNHVFRARLFDKGNQPKFVSWWGNSRGLDYFIRSGKQTTNLASINKTMLAALPIRLPSAAEQAEIVRRVEALFALADNIEARYAAARAQAQRLSPLVLAKAFRGELVPQDPNDEPASELLKRIRAEKSDRQPEAKIKRSSKEMPMKPTSKENLSEIVKRMPKDVFTFDELRDAASRDYESLKDELFVLLADTQSGLQQFFDAEQKSMKLKRVRA